MRAQASQCHSNTVAPEASTSTSNPNFDDEDNEWELGVGDLIIDLDADIERNNPLTKGSGKSSEQSLKMNAIEHQATVDKPGLKMKIKRKSGGAKSDPKHEIVKTDPKLAANVEIPLTNTTVPVAKGGSPAEGTSKDKTPKGRAVNKKDKGKEKAKPAETVTASTAAQNGYSNYPSTSDSTDTVSETDKEVKREGTPTSLDPYEFNAKVEDQISLPSGPTKKPKLEKMDTGSSISSTDVSTETCQIGTLTDPECLGPCEPGTSVNLEGIVWQETENGVLVVNVTWRGKTYVGTLLDATKHDWAPPRLNCDSPTSDLDTRTPKGRAKRGGRGSTPHNEVAVTETRKLRKGRRGNIAAPPSPAKSESAPVTGVKRKGRPADLDLAAANEDQKATKRNRTSSRGTPGPADVVVTPGGFIECPEPNCNKKYRHINGLRYHQSHAHAGNSEEKSSEDSRPCTPQTAERKTPTRKTRESANAEKNKQKAASTEELMDTNEKTSKDADKNCDKKDEAAVADDEVASTSGTSSAANAQRAAGVSVIARGSGGQSRNVVTAVTVPITTVATAATIDELKSDSKSDKKKKGDKEGKGKGNNKPVAPATPSSSSSTASGSSPHSSSTSQISGSNPKPSQQKSPAEEPSTGAASVSSSVVGKEKEKKQKHKKNKKEKENGVKKDDAKGVIKAVPSPSNTEGEQSEDVSKNSVIREVNNSSPFEIKSDTAEQPNENAPSPAYSDISDPNDSNSVMETDISDKPKEQTVKQPPVEGNPVDRNIDPASMKPYGYSYYGQPPYLIPNIPEAKQAAQGAVAPPNCPSSAEQASLVKSNELKLDSVKSDKVGNLSKDANRIEKGSPNQIVPQGQETQQKTPYMYPSVYGGYAMDPQYHVHLMQTDPNYKAQHEAGLEEQARKEQTNHVNKDLSKERVPSQSFIDHSKIDGQRHSAVSSPHSLSSASSSSVSVPLDQNKNRNHDQKYNRPMSEKEVLENDKKIESRIVMKDNMDMKLSPSSSVVDDRTANPYKHQEMDRYIMYQNQQRRYEDERRRMEDDKRKIEPNSKQPSEQSKPRDSSAHKDNLEKSIHKDSQSKREMSHDLSKKDVSVDKNRERVPEKRHHEDRPKSADKRSPSLNSKKPESMGAPTACATSPNMNMGPSSSYAYHLSHPYMQSPHYGSQLHYDPNHPMYRGMNPVIGYSGAYMHPSQMRYHMDPSEKDRIPVVAHGQASEQTKALDLLQQHASYYSAHKIHELEKAQKGEIRASPKSAEAQNLLSASIAMANKHKEFTNSPPPQRHQLQPHPHAHPQQHLIGGYPMYDHYAMMASQSAAASGLPHHYASK